MCGESTHVTIYPDLRFPYPTMGIASCPLQVNQVPATSVRFQPQAGQAARKAKKKRGNSIVPLQAGTFLGFGRPEPLQALGLGVWEMYYLLSSH